MTSSHNFLLLSRVHYHLQIPSSREDDTLALRWTHLAWTSSVKVVLLLVTLLALKSMHVIPSGVSRCESQNVREKYGDKDICLDATCSTMGTVWDDAGTIETRGKDVGDCFHVA